MGSIAIRDFPEAAYLTAGVYMEDQDKAMVCGGYQCIEGR